MLILFFGASIARTHAHFVLQCCTLDERTLEACEPLTEEGEAAEREGVGEGEGDFFKTQILS